MTEKTRTTLKLNSSDIPAGDAKQVRRAWIDLFGSDRAKEVVRQDYPEARIYRDERAAKSLQILGVPYWYGRRDDLKRKPKKKGSPSEAALFYVSGLTEAMQAWRAASGDDEALSCSAGVDLMIAHIEQPNLADLFSRYGAHASMADACMDPLLDEESWRDGEAILLEGLFPHSEAIVLPVAKQRPMYRGKVQ